MTSFFAVPTMLDAAEPAAGLRHHRPVGAAHDRRRRRHRSRCRLLRTWLDRGITVQQALRDDRVRTRRHDARQRRRAWPRSDRPASRSSSSTSGWSAPTAPSAPPGEIGEVVLSGPNIMAGYWDAPEETAAAIVDGWYHSGDAGSHRRGRLPLHPRPLQGHDHLRRRERVPRRDRVRAARARPTSSEVAVIGVPDAKWGEVGLRRRRPRAGRRARRRGLRARCANGSPGSRCPSTVELADELPQDRHRQDPQARPAQPLRAHRGDPRMSTTTTTSPNCRRSRARSSAPAPGWTSPRSGSTSSPRPPATTSGSTSTSSGPRPRARSAGRSRTAT